MKQVLQDLKSGQVVVLEVPEPARSAGRVLVRVAASVLSAGTESAQIAKARESLLLKIRQKPELLAEGLRELKARGIGGLRQRIADKKDGYSELGYSCSGIVIDSGGDPDAPPPGTLVACAGFGYATHAEIVSVPRLLVAPATSEVSPEAAAYATIGAIAMQGIRQAEVRLGEYVAVIGLGLVGLLCVQLLRALGCKVVGIDPSPAARKRALSSGCDKVAANEDALECAKELSRGFGVDAVIICAAAPDSSPVELAGQIARSRGRIVMVGSSGMTIPRTVYYMKELSFSLSRSYGPGRYDPTYEEDGLDYPIDHVRFTEQRNMTAFLELAAKGAIHPEALTTHRYSVEQGQEAFALLNDRTADRAGIVLTYNQAPRENPRFTFQVAKAAPSSDGKIGIGFIGAGAYAQGMLLPLLRDRPNAALITVMTRTGSHGMSAAKKFGFQNACTRIEEVLSDSSIHVVFITTRHDSHAGLVCEALKAGKHVWVEKPLVLTLDELKTVAATLRESKTLRLMVGFNRPFAKSAQWLAVRLGSAAPRMMLYRVNAGTVPIDSWVNDPSTGGGRLLGEGCHFFDFVRHIAQSRAVSVHTECVQSERADLPATANFSSSIRFENGSVAQVLYTAQGSAGLPKEYFECFAGSSAGTLNDYQSAEFYNAAQRESLGRHTQDKGQKALMDAFLRCIIEGSGSPVSHESLVESTVLTLAAQQSLLERRIVNLQELRNEVLS